MHLNFSQLYRYGDSRPRVNVKFLKFFVSDLDSMSGESLTTVNANDITKNAATNNTKVDTNFTHLIRRPSEHFNFTLSKIRLG